MITGEANSRSVNHDQFLGAAVLNVHCTDPTNVGDANSSPLRYFELPGAREIDCSELPFVSDEVISKSIVIFGGGGLIGYSEKWDEMFRRVSSLTPGSVIWGAGVNRHLRPFKAKEYVSWGLHRVGASLKAVLSAGSREPAKSDSWLPDYVERFALAGIRDTGAPAPVEWVPCASCMRPEFDRTWTAKRKVGVFQHRGVPIRLDLSVAPEDRMDNKKFSVEEVLEFIGGSESIVTSSYHGAYWATLMGKPTVIYQPFSTKFARLRHPLVSYSGDLRRDFAESRTYSTALRECREANRSFYQKVRALSGDLNPEGAVRRT